MTDEMFLREFLSDQSISKYSVIILDEAHEGTLTLWHGQEQAKGPQDYCHVRIFEY
jgi:hypothetical protein